MAYLRDFLPAVRSVGPFKFVMNIVNEVAEDNIATLAAAVAYSWLFAIFPFIIFLLTLAPYLPADTKAEVTKQIDHSVSRIVVDQGAQVLMQSIHEVLHEPRAGLLSVGLIVTLWAASGGVAMTMTALDTAFDAQKVQPFYKQRPIAILLTIVITVLVLLVTLLLPISTAVLNWLLKWKYINAVTFLAVNVLRYGLALLTLLCVLSLLYRFGTTVKQKYSLFSPGALFTVITWIALGEGFRQYVMRFGQYQKTYGAVGGVVIVLFVFYLDALMLLIGAEINSEVTRARKT